MKRYSLLLFLTLLLKFPYAQIPNAGFENWTNLQPDNWIHNSCPYCDPPWESYIVRQDSDVYSGNFNVDFYGNGVFKPYAYTQFPVAYRPLKLKFYTKISFPPCINTPGNAGDTVAAKVELLYQGAVVDSGYWSYSDTNVTNYQLIEVPLTGNALAFDSCRVYFEGGQIFGGCGTIAEATQFKVDQTELVFESITCSASFYYAKRVDTVDFYSSSNSDSIIISWMWDFGDGNLSGSDYPQHIYAQDSWYNVCLTIAGLDTSSDTCTATYCDSILITHDCIDTSQICPPPSLCCDAPLYDPVCGCDSVTYGNACQASAWYGVTKFTQGPCITSVKNIPNAIKVSLIPNPVHDKIQLNLELQEQGVVMVRMKNTLGEIFSELTTPVQHNLQYEHEINLTDMPNGIYFLEIWLNEKICAVKKFVKD